ncbi:MAG: DUF1513 domain-containing protein, partial [Rhizobiaceae bacterium]|nr:DUF1513 domain-containing protein [Rhizobiaceae bacterium]
MSRSVLDRRKFVIGSGATIVSLSSALSPSTAEISSPACYAAALRHRNGTYAVGLLDEAGQLLDTHALPARGHGVTFHRKTQRAVIFARRPGTFALQFSPDNKTAPVLFACPPDRHFYGHGSFSPDGQLLFTTENHFDAAAGMIGVYRMGQTVNRIGEFPSYGVGPHDIYYDAWRGLLCIANGGIETHPDFGRAKLNLDRMQSNIAF